MSATLTQFSQVQKTDNGYRTYDGSSWTDWSRDNSDHDGVIAQLDAAYSAIQGTGT